MKNQNYIVNSSTHITCPLVPLYVSDTKDGAFTLLKANSPKSIRITSTKSHMVEVMLTSIFHRNVTYPKNYSTKSTGNMQDALTLNGH